MAKKIPFYSRTGEEFDPYLFIEGAKSPSGGKATIATRSAAHVWAVVCAYNTLVSTILQQKIQFKSVSFPRQSSYSQWLIRNSVYSRTYDRLFRTYCSWNKNRFELMISIVKVTDHLCCALWLVWFGILVYRTCNGFWRIWIGL